MSDVTIPFNRPCLVGNELQYIEKAVLCGHTAGDGEFTRLCERWLETQLDVPRVLLTTSCTHALEMAALLVGCGPGDDVVVPSFTFVSTANAFAIRGARPAFVDVRSDTLNLDEQLLEKSITLRTKAIVPVHYAGVGCCMEEIGHIATRHGIPVIEDNAHGLFARRSGRLLGTSGALGALSFHETKNFICGEGGALIVNDPVYRERAEIVREKGTNRKRFLSGQVDKYTWVDIGSSYVPSDLLAAFLWAQLERRDQIFCARSRVWRRYYAALAAWAPAHGARLPVVPPDCEQSYHMFYMLMASNEQRESLIRFLRQRGILAVFHYQPLHLSTMGRMFGGYRGQCPVTEAVAERLVRLPFYNDLSEDGQDTVVQAIYDWGRHC